MIKPSNLRQPSEDQYLNCIRCGACLAVCPTYREYLGGSLSGEHGVGALKRPYMEQAQGSVSIEVQKRIKAALDPVRILNPGKIFPN